MSKHIDSLTLLPDKKALELSLKQMLKENDEVALALLDVDHFLEINETNGSEVGDQVLQTLADILKEAVHENVFRVSGDEFAVVLPTTSLEQAFLRMEALRTKVQEAGTRFEMATECEVTVTIGVAQFPRDAKDETSLMRASNAALMTAKETGRNQVALPPNEEMVMKSCYYPATGVRKLKSLAEKLNQKESHLLREALNDLVRKYDQP